MPLRPEDVARLGPAAQRQIYRKVVAEQERKATKKKFGNVPTKRNGIKFDSKKEALRYDQLMVMLRAGEISDLKLQPQYTLQESYVTPESERVRAIRYVADFSYWQKGEFVVEDVKSKATATAQYKLKKKLMQERFGISVKEV